MTFDRINSDIVRVLIDGDIKHRGVSIRRRNEKTRSFGWRLMGITERYKISPSSVGSDFLARIDENNGFDEP